MLVTICIPAYEAGRFIERALESVRKQTYVDWELVVVEDGSSDPVETQVHHFSESVSQSVRYIRHDQNRGLTSARNTALKAACGEFVAMLDADDYWAEAHLSQLVALQKSSQADVVYAGSLVFEEPSGDIVAHRRPTELDLTQFPLSLYRSAFTIQPSAIAIRRSKLLEIGGSDESFSHCEDLELWFRAAKNGLRFGFSGNDTCFYRKHPAAMSMNFPLMAQAVARVYCKHYDWHAIPIRQRKRHTASALLSAGRLIWHRQPGSAYGWIAASLAVRPSLLGLAYLVATVFSARRRRERLQRLSIARANPA